MSYAKRRTALSQRSFAKERGEDCPYCHARGEVAGIDGDQRYAGLRGDSLVVCECGECGAGWFLVEAAIGYVGLTPGGVTGTPSRDLFDAADALGRTK